MNHVSGTVQARATCCWTVPYAAWWRIWRRRWQSGCAAAGPSAWFRGSHARGAVAVAASRCTALPARLCSATGAPQSVPRGHIPHSRAPVLRRQLPALQLPALQLPAIPLIVRHQTTPCQCTSRVLIPEEWHLEIFENIQQNLIVHGLCSVSLSPLDVG